MAGRRVKGDPAPLARARERFESWRRGRSRGTRIPEALWELATKLAAEYGVSRTSMTLRVDYYALQERVESRQQAASSTEAFVELSPPAVYGGGECTIELTDGKGASLRIQLKNQATPDLIALSRSFCQG